MAVKNASGVVPAVPISVPFSPDDLIPIGELARRLHNTEAWVREKTRRRCPNPIPVHNLGRHLMFEWSKVCEWIRNCPRPVHAPHKRRKKEQIEVVKKRAA